MGHARLHVQVHFAMQHAAEVTAGQLEQKTNSMNETAAGVE
jgi:hypothetical protein